MGLRDFAAARTGGAFTRRSSRYLNCPSNLISHDRLNKPANGEGTTRRFDSWAGAALAKCRAANHKRETGMFQGQFDLDGATPVAATAIPDVLFERGLYWASGRSGVVNLVAAHKWFNLAAWKGRIDAVALRREVAEMMSDGEIAAAQREARSWMTAY
jgi:uncharacterized protein